MTLLFVLTAGSWSACSKGALTKSSPDGSVDGSRTSDVSPQPKDAFPDATIDIGTTDRADTQAVDTGPWEAKAPVDVGTESPYDARDSGDADASSFPDVPAFVDAPPEGQRDTRVLVDRENDGGRETGGGPDEGMDGQSEAGAPDGGGNERSQVDSMPAAVLAVSASTVDVGDVDLGDSASGTVVVTNHGTASSGSMTVTSAPWLTVTGCVEALLPQASCTLLITVTPTLAGEVCGTALRVSSWPARPSSGR